jgi:hypothetical protein
LQKSPRPQAQISASQRVTQHHPPACLPAIEDSPWLTVRVGPYGVLCPGKACLPFAVSDQVHVYKRVLLPENLAPGTNTTDSPANWDQDSRLLYHRGRTGTDAAYAHEKLRPGAPHLFKPNITFGASCTDAREHLRAQRVRPVTIQHPSRVYWKKSRRKQ